MLWTSYNFNFKSLLIFGKHIRNGRHKSSLHLFTSVLKNSLIRTKWHWVKMTFPPLPAHQSGHDTRRALPGGIDMFLEVFRRKRLLLLQMRCPLLTSCYSEDLQETFLHSKTTLHLKTKKTTWSGSNFYQLLFFCWSLTDVTRIFQNKHELFLDLHFTNERKPSRRLILQIVTQPLGTSRVPGELLVFSIHNLGLFS